MIALGDRVGERTATVTRIFRSQMALCQGILSLSGYVSTG